MRLKRVQVRDYRSVNDSGEFEVEHDKTILVEPPPSFGPDVL